MSGRWIAWVIAGLLIVGHGCSSSEQQLSADAGSEPTADVASGLSDAQLGGADADDGTPNATDGGPAPALFDLDAIRDPVTAACAFTNHRQAVDDGVSLDVWDVSYYSWESIDGELQPILIRGFAARPTSMTAGARA